jgi:hypothetical protein
MMQPMVSKGGNAMSERQTPKEQLSWFSAKGLFKHTCDNPRIQERYEESIVILKAASEDLAAERARKLFEKYSDKELGIVFTGAYEICGLFEPVREGREVYWFMRLSSLSPKKYVETYWDDGRPQSCDQKGWTHFWHNIDNKNSGCLNCRQVRKGQLWKRRRPASPGTKVKRPP